MVNRIKHLRKLIDDKYRQYNAAILDRDEAARIMLEIDALEQIDAELSDLLKFADAAQKERRNWT